MRGIRTLAWFAFWAFVAVGLVWFGPHLAEHYGRVAGLTPSSGLRGVVLAAVLTGGVLGSAVVTHILESAAAKMRSKAGEAAAELEEALARLEAGVLRTDDFVARLSGAAGQLRQITGAPKLPSRAADLERWQATWAVIETPVRAGGLAYQLDFALQESDLPEKWKAPDRKTLDRIIAAGRAGLLDDSA